MRLPVGLERIFRFFQAVVQIIASYPAVFSLFLIVLDYGTGRPHPPADTLSILLTLRQRFNLARRFLRLFRFLESFHAAHKLYVSIAPSNQAGDKQRSSRAEPEAWLDVFARTFNGMYLLLEVPAIVTELKIEGLQLWSPEWDRTVAVEAQRFWLFALVCAALSGMVKMRRIQQAEPAAEGKGGSDSGKAEGSSTAVVAEKFQREKARKMRGLARSVVANTLDIVVPGVVVGWVKVSPGVVGLAMFVTTILTGMDVWERCG